jgi:hypothetical protein
MRTHWTLLGLLAVLGVGCRDTSPTTDGGADAGPGPRADGGALVPPAFSSPTFTASVAMAYAVETPLGVTGGSDTSFVYATVEAAPDELVVGFIGPGSLDQVLELAPAQTAPLQLSVTGINSLPGTYPLTVALYSLPTFDADLSLATKLGSATVALTLTEATFDVTLTQGSTDSATLVQHWQLTNRGDDLYSLDVVPSTLLGSMVTLRPELTHLTLAKNETLAFDVVPVLYPGMTAMGGTLVARDGQRSKAVQVSISPPTGKGVYLGFGASSWWESSAGSHCTNESPLTKQVGKGPRPFGPPKPQDPDFWSKKGMARLFSSSMDQGMAVGKAMKTALGASWLNVPFIALEQLNKHIAERIAEDPPDPNFRVLARPTFHAPPVVRPDAPTGLTQAGADALNAYIANGLIIADLGEAAMATIDKLGGARAAGDATWADKQEALLRAYSQMLLGRVQTQAGLLDAFAAVAPDTAQQAMSIDNVIAAQAALAANGFAPDELSDFAALGLDAATVSSMKAAILAVDPNEAGALGFQQLGAMLYSGEYVDSADLVRVLELSASTSTATRVLGASMLMRFELDANRCPIGPHTTVLSVNGKEVGRLTDTVPEGLYRFPVSPADVRFFGSLPGGNDLGIETIGLNTGNFVRALDAALEVQFSVHGELVVAADQAEADALVGALPTANHAQPDLVLAVTPAPPIDRSTLTDASVVNFALDVWNLGETAATATTVSLTGEDPRAGDPGPALLTAVPVPALAAGQSAHVTVPLPGALLRSLDVTYLFLTVAQPGDFQLGNNTVRLSNDRVCAP